MLIFLRRRLITSFITLLGIVLLTFLLARMTGNPATLYLPIDASREMIEAFNHQHGFDLPLHVQFINFLKDLSRLDFGMSLSQQRPAIQGVLAVMPRTLALIALSILLMLFVSLILGSLAALKPFSRRDNIITFISLGLTSLPDFWLALIGVLVFAVKFRVLPTSGMSGVKSWILPLVTLGIPPSGSMIQVVRGAMIEALNSSYVQNAKARGFSKTRLAFRHALRNAALPIITVAGDRAVHLFNGTIIVGAVFAWPGIGRTIIQAVMVRDFALLQASLFVTGVTIILLNIVIDIIYSIIDPRVRVS